MIDAQTRWPAPVRIAVYVAIVAVSLSIYLSNGESLTSYDSAPNSLLAFNVFATKRLDFDDFRGSYFGSLGGQYAFVEAPNGHLTSYFPIGTAILTLPIAALFWSIARPDGVTPPSAAFEPTRALFEKLAAAIVAACSVAIFFACATKLGNLAQASIVTAIYALCTSIWSIASQGLWQHGPVNFAVLAMAYGLLRARETQGNASIAWLAFAGIFAGLLPVIRPTAMLYTGASLAYAIWALRSRSVPFLVATILGLSPGVAWNLAFFHAPLGGYGSNLAMYSGNIGPAFAALAGLLVSPSRGLFFFSPILLLGIAGGIVAWRTRGPAAALLLSLAAAALLTVVQYAFFREWWGGFAYGPRFLTDTVAVAALLIVYVIPQRPLGFARGGMLRGSATVAFASVCVFCLTVQFAGANGGAAGSDWNAVPMSIDAAPARVWPLRDNQIERNVLAAYFRFFPPALQPAIVSVLSLTPREVAPGAMGVLSTVVRNVGTTPVYGYRSGRYAGQLRVGLSISQAGRLPSQPMLFLADTLAPGESSAMLGAFQAPTTSGDYRVVAKPLLVGGGTMLSKTPFRSHLLVR